jgi:hypothetical protein
LQISPRNDLSAPAFSKIVRHPQKKKKKKKAQNRFLKKCHHGLNIESPAPISTPIDSPRNYLSKGTNFTPNIFPKPSPCARPFEHDQPPNPQKKTNRHKVSKTTLLVSIPTLPRPF